MVFVENRIIKQPEVFNEQHIPDSLIARDKQIEELRLCLAPALRRRKPINAWLYGKPGTGKTAVTRFVLQQLLEESNVQGIYLNCWEYKTLFTIADKLVRDLKILFADRPDIVLKLERFQRTVGERPFVLILDEIDKPETKERNAILYQLSNIGNVGLVCICNSMHFLLSLDERIQSRLSPRQIGFHPYTSGELTIILRHRAEIGLDSNCWDTNALEKISELADGDARMAIQTLKKSAEIAEAVSAGKISLEHINRAWDSTKDAKKRYLLEKLTEHHRIIYGIIREQPSISSGKLWEYYLKVLTKLNRKPIATRTFSAYLSKLIETRLILAEQSDKRNRIFKVV